MVETKETKDSNQTDNLSNTEQKAVDYINKYRVKGYKDEEIKKALLNSGVKQEMITKLMSSSKKIGMKKLVFKEWWFWSAVSGVILLLLVIAMLLPKGIEIDAECINDLDCDYGYECVDGSCVEEQIKGDAGEEDMECYSDSDCPDNYDCESNECVYKGSESQCGDGNCDIGEDCWQDCGCYDDNDCPSGYDCDDGTCEKKSSGGGDSGGSGGSGGGTDGGTTSTPLECTSNSQCGTGYFCNSAGDCTATECNDGLDNDGDGLTDYIATGIGVTNDPDCLSLDDMSEDNAASNYDCDEDSDCLSEEICVDNECVQECLSTADCDEGYVCSKDGCVLSQCNDGLDNDGDGLIDYIATGIGVTNDPDCTSISDDSESYCVTDSYCLTGYECVDGTCVEESVVTTNIACTGYECSDECDNDGDGLINMLDRGCISTSDDDERNDCADGYDNDGDGFVDLLDSECSSPADLTENIFERECNDGLDNDNDGLVDYGLDPGCSSPYTDDERNDCADGYDNDGDGLIDTLFRNKDPDCGYPGDKTEQEYQRTFLQRVMNFVGLRR